LNAVGDFFSGLFLDRDIFFQRRDERFGRIVSGHVPAGVF
jgi:hypothetical protein